MTHIAFPSINQFRHVVQHVRRKASFIGLDDAGEPIYNLAAKAPTLTFVGTVKLHGTNAAIVFSPEGIQFQSRERVLTWEQDNAGFYAHMQQHNGPMGALEDMYLNVVDAVPGLAKNVLHTVAVYGEWCGGNIQKGVAITGLPKMFVIFAIKVNGDWISMDTTKLVYPEASIYSIEQFDDYVLTIDFEQPETAQNILASMTERVEASCPVGRHFGQEGIGEGIVWRCASNPSSDLWFKVKGEKHSASKVKTLAPVDVEAVENLREFVAKVVTEARLEQGLQNLINEQAKPFDMTSMGDFIRWVHGDIVKEESDTAAASGLEFKKVSGLIAQAAKRWYVEMLNKDLSTTK